MIRIFAAALVVLLSGCTTAYLGLGMEKGSGNEARMRAADAQSLAGAQAVYRFTPQTETSHYGRADGKQLTIDGGAGITSYLDLIGGFHFQTSDDGSGRQGSGIDCFKTCQQLNWSIGTTLFEYSIPLQLVGHWNVPRVPHLQWFVSAGAAYSFQQIETTVCAYTCKTGGKGNTGLAAEDYHYAKGSNSITPMLGAGLEWRFMRLSYSVRELPIATGWSGTPGTITQYPKLNLTLDKQRASSIGLAFFFRGD